MATFREWVVSRIPSRNQILPVFGVVVFIVYTWMFYRMSWYAPSWLSDFDIWGVLSIGSYAIVFSLFESAAMMGILLLLVILLPGHSFKETFTPTGSTIITILGFGAFLLQRKIRVIYTLEMWDMVLYTILVVVASIFLIYIFSQIYLRINWATKIITSAAELMVVFLFLYIPLSLLSFGYLIFRSIFLDSLNF